MGYAIWRPRAPVIYIPEYYYVGLFTRVGLVRTSDKGHWPHGAKLNIKQ